MATAAPASPSSPARPHGLKLIVVDPRLRADGPTPEARLLTALGHDVRPASSVRHAVTLLREAPGADAAADVVVVDLGAAAANEASPGGDATAPPRARRDANDGSPDELARLLALPGDRQPRKVAVFSDERGQFLSLLRDRVDPDRLHVYPKPFHMHGLLGLIRSMDAGTVA